MILKKVKVKDLGKVITGTTPPTKIKEYYADEYNFIKPSYIEKNVRFFNESEEKLSELAKEKYINTFVPELSTCVVTIGSIGEKICLTKELCLTNQQINTVIPNEKYDNMFVYYLLKYNLFKVKAANAGSSSGRENVNKSTFENIEVEVPNIQIQKKIAKILAAYDDLIENNLKRIKLLEESAELLYKEWFVNFRYPGYHNKKLIKGIPEGWNKVCISQFADISNGYAFKSKDFNSVGDKIIKIKNISDNSIDTANCDCVSSDITEKLLRFEIKEGDILIAMTGATVGKSGMMPRETERYFLNQRVGRIKSNIDIDISAFIYYLIKSDYVYNSMVNIAKGSAQPNISTTDIGNIQVTFPTKDILVLFEERVSCMFKSRLNLIAQNQKLKEARDILIPKLITGEIEV